MRILITGGPTREPLDPVRFLSNRSSGRMAFALARAAQARGCEVTLVLGPVAGQPPVGVDVVAVETAREMHDAALAQLDDAGAIVCAAAVADYRPAAASERKLKRDGGPRTIELVPNPDIAAALGARRGDRPLAVFALEDEDGVARARTKLAAKNATLCVLNGPEAQGADEAGFTLVRRDGEATELGVLGKDALAERLFAELLA